MALSTSPEYKETKNNRKLGTGKGCRGRGGGGAGLMGGRAEQEGIACLPCTWAGAQTHQRATRLQGCPQQPLWPALLAWSWKRLAAAQGLVPATALPLALLLPPDPCLTWRLPGSALCQPAWPHPTAQHSVVGVNWGKGGSKRNTERMQRHCCGFAGQQRCCLGTAEGLQRGRVG